MTSTIALVLALSLILNDLTLLLDESILGRNFLAANLMFLLSSTILLGQLQILPKKLWNRSYYLYLLLEVPLAAIFLECSVHFIWRFIQHYVHSNSDRLLVHLADDRGLEGLVCYFCCGKTNCSGIIADLVLKGISFTFLFGVCAFLGFK